MTDRVGQQLGHYRLIRLLGKGGFAQVYLGEHLDLNTYAAVKVLQSQLTSDEVRSFRKEAQTLAQMRHPHIVRVLDFGVDGDTPYLIMDYAPNGTLRQRHPFGAMLPLATIVTYVKQIAEALQHAHNNNVIHRDIKPENMLLGSQNEVLLSDFGIATVAQSSQAQHTQTIVGTVNYMAPEQAQGNPRPASDQYALGVIVYEWLSGDRPFHGTAIEVTTQHIHRPPPPLHQKIAGISPILEQVVMKALEKDPHQRFTSIKDFADALEQCLLAPTKVQVSTPPKPQPPPRVAPRPLTAVTLPSTVPALPKPSAAHLSWPTFSLSLTDRQDISCGKLPQEPLVTTGQVLIAPPGPLPIVMVPPPPLTLQGRPPTPPVAVNVQQGAVQPIIQIPPSGQPGRGGIIRSIGASPSVQPGVGQPVAKGGMNIVRSSGSPSTSSKKTQLPPSTTELAQANRLGVTSLITACTSIIAFVVTCVFALYEQQIFAAYSQYTQAAAWDTVIIFIATILAFSTGVAAMRKKGVLRRAKSLAGSGITISILITLLEITWLSLHPLR